ncbi:MAG: AAA family ATPase [Myxococcota bacterium]
MKARFHLFVSTFPDKWVSASVLTHPRYTAIGRDLGAVRDELEQTLARDLALSQFDRSAGSHPAEFPGPSPDASYWEALEVESISLALRAVQHERLVEVPMSFTLAVHPDGKDDRFTVRVPRLELQFSLVGRRDLRAWAEERIRGHLHLADVRQLVALRAARKERVEPLEVTWHGPGRYLKERAERAERVHQVVEAAASVGPTLGGVGVDWVDEAKHGRLGRALDRSAEVDRLVQTLSRHHQRAGLLVGAHGVGKTAVVQELCHRIAQGSVPGRLAGASVWYVPGNALMAGMKYLGEWQARALGIAKHLAATGDVLYVGHLGELLGADTEAGGLSPGQLFLPFLQRDAFPLVAETTPEGLVHAEHQHAGFVRALRQLPVLGMERDRAFAVLEVLAKRIARDGHGGAEVTPEALSAALELLARYGDPDGLPGSGLPLVERMIQGNPRARLNRTHAIAAFARGSGLPEVLVDPDRGLDEASVRAHFERRIVGQPEAARRLTELVLVVKAGLSDPGRPLGSLLLLGPTGVGKTESAKALASWMFGDDDRLVRFDMSEFGGLGAARRLVDGPGGQGLLTRKVREQPFGVVLLDEVEKAEPAVFDVLLQVLGEGRLTDGTGSTVSFRHTVVILTSNLGASAPPEVGLVPAPPGADALRYRRAAEAFFRPEFVNRLDLILPYQPLSEAAVREIGRGLLTTAVAREGVARRGVEVRWGDDVLEHVVRVGYQPQWGARPMKRAIETEVLAPLGRALARGGHGQVLQLVVRDGRVVVV